MKILHITNWHPNQENPYEAIWMRRHVEALANHAEQEVWHLEVRGGKKLKFHKYTDEMGCHHRILNIPMNRWFIIELLTAFLLWWNLRFKIKWKEFDILNIHIAYPLLTYWGWCKKMVKMPVVITEHWSAYHFNFGMPKDTNKLNKIKNIFNQGIPLFAVSKALTEDIANFANNLNIERYVVPNVVQTDIFHNQSPQMPKEPTFFMVSGWSFPKTPNIVIQAFAVVLKQYPNAKLKIGGLGQLLPEMQKLVKLLGIKEQVSFLGKLNAKQIAAEQNKASAFLHSSEYETFSVVCVEALACGTPVIASKVGGIPEYINEQNGLLVTSQDVDSWIKKLMDFMEVYEKFDRPKIANELKDRFGYDAVGQTYFEALNEVYKLLKTEKN